MYDNRLKEQLRNIESMAFKQLKQYSLDHDTTLTAIAMEAFQEFLELD